MLRRFGLWLLWCAPLFLALSSLCRVLVRTLGTADAVAGYVSLALMLVVMWVRLGDSLVERYCARSAAHDALRERLADHGVSVLDRNDLERVLSTGKLNAP